MTNELEDLDARFKQIATVVMAAVYATIKDLAPDSITILPNVVINSESFGLLMLGTGALIFGKGIGATSAGLGVIFDEFKVVLDGQPLPAINIGLIFSTVALSVSTWLTGFLENARIGDYIPENFQEIFSGRELVKVSRKTVVSVVGLSLANNFFYAFGGQLMEGAPIGNATMLFLTAFLRDAILLVVGMPILLISYEFIEVYNQKKERIIEELNKDILYKIEVMKSAEIINVELPENALKEGVWTPISVELMNPSKKKTAYNIEAVFTANFYPELDATPVLDPGMGWRQNFYVLPRKQEKITGRIRITPKKPKKFKFSEPEETIVEIEANSRKKGGPLVALLGLSGLNFGALGLSLVWEQIQEYVKNPNLLQKQVLESLQVISNVLIAEILLFIGAISTQYFMAKRKSKVYSSKISFASDIDDQKIEAVKEKALKLFMKKYGKPLAIMFRSLIGIGTIITFAYFGYNAFMISVNPDSRLSSNNDFAIISAIGLGLWVFGFRGMQILNEITTGKSTRNANNFIREFIPLGNIEANIPTEVILRIVNISEYPGMRVLLKSDSAISPPMIELHTEPGELAQVKIVLTADMGDSQNILALAYPFFDKNKKLIPFEEAEPLAKQEIDFKITPPGTMGMSKEQEKKVKTVGAMVTGFAGILTVLGQVLQIGNTFDFIINNAPTILALQVPLMAGYFRVSSLLKRSKAGGIDL